MIRLLQGLGNLIMSEIKTKLIMDNEFNKLIYYKNENGNILELPELDDPFTQLENQIFDNRRPSKVLEEQDVCVFIYLDDNRNFSATSKKIKTVWVKIGFVVHQDCSKTESGIRESSIISCIQRIVDKSYFENAIGRCKLERPVKLNGLPYNWNGYEVSVKADGWADMI